MILYMFRALYVHHQEVGLYWCNICYRYSQVVFGRWPRIKIGCCLQLLSYGQFQNRFFHSTF